MIYGQCIYVKDHTVDVNAIVRSRALQLWTRLARASQIPIVFINGGLIRDVGGRLIDKSVSVRRNAAMFLSAILEYNPFGASVSLKLVDEVICRDLESLGAIPLIPSSFFPEVRLCYSLQNISLCLIFCIECDRLRYQWKFLNFAFHAFYIKVQTQSFSSPDFISPIL